MTNVPENAIGNGDQEHSYQQQLRTILSREKKPSARRIQKLLRLGEEWFNVELGLLVKVDQSGATRTINEGSDPSPELTQGLTGNLLSTYCRMVAAEKPPLVVANTPTQDWCDGDSYQSSLLGTYIGIEAQLDGDVYGAICFVDLAPRETAFEEKDRTFLERLAQGIGRRTAVPNRSQALSHHLREGRRRPSLRVALQPTRRL